MRWLKNQKDIEICVHFYWLIRTADVSIIAQMSYEQ
jgi:hypothetical protein